MSGITAVPPATLPGHPHIRHDEAGALWIEDVPAADLAERHGTPLYAYSRASVRAALQAYQRALAGREHLICYAMKANSNLALLQLLAAEGCGFDIVSGGELERVLAAGGDAARVVFSGVGKTEPEMARALEAGVLCFNVESEAEIDTLSRVAVRSGRTARVSVRVNPDVDAGTHPYISTGLKNNKFGVAHGRALEVYRRAAALPGLEIVGIDCHIGSQITEVAPYLDALDRVLDLVEAIERDGIRIHHLDVGGGLGITYRDEVPPAADALVTALIEHLTRRGHAHRRLMFEPGRSLVGNAGVLLTRAVVLKGPANDPSGGDPQAKNFCIVDAAMNDLMRPAMYGAWMGIVEATPNPGAPTALYDVVGPVCESGDWLGRDRTLAVRPGSLLAVLSAGAYAMSMASNYNTRGRAAEVLVDGNRSWLIRDREQPSELFRHEHLLPADALR
jgi:diaminopimelate decarboxylase